MGMSMSYVQVIAVISNEQYALGDDVTSRVGSNYVCITSWDYPG